MNEILVKLAGLSSRGLLILAGLILGGYYMMFFDDGATLDKRITDTQAQIGPAEIQAAEAEKQDGRGQHLLHLLCRSRRCQRRGPGIFAGLRPSEN